MNELLERTRDILDGLSSGSLSPVSLPPLSNSMLFDRLEQLKAAFNEPELVALEEFNELAEERFGPQNWTALHVAALECPENEAVFEYLLRRGVDALAKDSQGQRARQLLGSSASSRITTWLQEWEGRQVCAKKEKLFRLCTSETASFKSILVESGDGSALLERVACGITPLHQLVSRNRASILKRLLSKLPHLICQLPTCLTSLNGNTILHEAARWGSNQCIEEILKVAPDLAQLKNSQNLLPIDLCSSTTNKALFTDIREELKLDQIIEMLDTETGPESSPKKRGRPRIYQPGQSPSKLKKLRQQTVKEPGIVRKEPPKEPVFRTESLKRGPGRPRKSAPAPLASELDILSGKCDLSYSFASIVKQRTSKLLSVPVSKIFADSIGCVLLVRLRGEWWAFSHQLEAIHTWLQDQSEDSEKNATLLPHLKTNLTSYDRERLKKLPDLGRLIAYLKSHPLSSLLPKATVVSFLESTHQLALTGPFGYVDVDQLSPVRPAPLPLKLKLKMEASAKNDFPSQKEPKSPRILQM